MADLFPLFWDLMFELAGCLVRSYDWAKDVLDHLAGASKAHNGQSLKVTLLGCMCFQKL